jgi:hypothetical protein
LGIAKKRVKLKEQKETDRHIPRIERDSIQKERYTANIPTNGGDENKPVTYI